MQLTNINFCFCLPLSRTDFDLTMTSDQFDFAKHFMLSKEGSGRDNYEFYYSEICKPYLQLKKIFSPYGFNFIDTTYYKQIPDLLITKSEVIILFSHCIGGGNIDRESIEFGDGMCNWRKIIDIIPTDFSGLIDLAVCKPLVLAHQLKISRPQCLVKSSSRKIRLIFWIYFYSELFKNMLENEIDYLDALEYTLTTLNSKYVD